MNAQILAIRLSQTFTETKYSYLIRQDTMSTGILSRVFGWFSAPSSRVSSPELKKKSSASTRSSSSERSTQTPKIEHGGVTVFLVDTNDNGAKMVNNVLMQYSDEERQKSMIYTDYPINYKNTKSTVVNGFDLDNLSLWTLKRRNNPELSTFVVFDTAVSFDIYDSVVYDEVTRFSDELNVSVYIIMPVRHISKQVLVNADRVVLPKPRKTETMQRLAIHTATCPKSTTYHEFIDHWTSLNKEGKTAVIENGCLRSI